MPLEKDGAIEPNEAARPMRETHVTVSACRSLKPPRYSRAARATATAAEAIVAGEREYIFSSSEEKARW